MGDSVLKHAGPISLTDTHPRTEHLQNPTATRSKPQRWKACSSEMLKLLVAAIVGGRSPLLSSRRLN
jgi:hypothetical protein